MISWIQCPVEHEQEHHQENKQQTGGKYQYHMNQWYVQWDGRYFHQSLDHPLEVYKGNGQALAKCPC